MESNIVRASSEGMREGLVIGFEEVAWLPDCLIVHLAGYIDFNNHRYLLKQLERVVEKGFSRFFTVSYGLETSLAHFTKKPEPPVFAKVFACPLCAARLRAGRAGRFRCPRCRTILVLSDTGAVEPVSLPMVPIPEGA